MKIQPVGVELFHADWQPWRSRRSLFAILFTCQKSYFLPTQHSYVFLYGPQNKQRLFTCTE